MVIGLLFASAIGTILRCNPDEDGGSGGGLQALPSNRRQNLRKQFVVVPRLSRRCTASPYERRRAASQMVMRRACAGGGGGCVGVGPRHQSQPYPCTPFLLAALACFTRQ